MQVPADTIIRIRNLSLTSVMISFVLMLLGAIVFDTAPLGRIGFRFGLGVWAFGMLLPVLGSFLRCPACDERLLTFNPIRQIRHPFGLGCPWCGANFVRSDDV